MRRAMRMVIVLGVVGLISGTSLVLVYNYATPLIEANQKRELEEAIFKIVPGATGYKAVTKEDEEFFEVYDKNEKLLGYAVIAEGNGYQGKIKLIAGIKKDLANLYGIEILESQETPGLGGEIASDKFKGQFKNLKVFPKIEVEAITGATISSQSVMNILNEKIAKVIEILKK